jgi:hypothetical protein
MHVVYSIQIPFQNIEEQFHLSGQGCAFGRMLGQGRAVLEKIRAENWVVSIACRAQTDKNEGYQEPQIWRSSLDVAYVCICCHVLSSFNELLMLHRLGASTFQHTSALLAFSVPWRLGAMLPKFQYCILLHEWPDGQTWPDCSDGSESHVNVDKTWTIVEHKTQSNLWRSGRFLLPTKVCRCPMFPSVFLSCYVIFFCNK